MIKFDKPKNLNGAELRKELLNAGVKIGDNGTEVVIDEYGDFWLDISKADVSKTIKAEAEAKAQAKASAEGKLAALGLTTNDLRALGL